MQQPPTAVSFITRSDLMQFLARVTLVVAAIGVLAVIVDKLTG